MSLRDAIRDLRNVARRLDVATFNSDMSALEKLLEGIKIDKPAKPPEDVLQKLLTKYLRGGRDFSSREIRSLPFIIYEPSITSNAVREILSLLDFSRTNHLRGVLSVYLLNHDDSNKTERLRRELNNVHGVESASLRKIFAARDRLFSVDCFTNMTRLFAAKLSVAASLETIGLSNYYKASNFIQTALKNFFRADMPLPTQFKILEELDSEFDTYKNIFPAVADAMIQTVHRAGCDKDKCLAIFYGRLGDPRFGDSRFNWHGVSQKSIDIFSHWLSAEDLETFFELIRQTAVDSMWRYREKFWRAYLPYIVKTRIFLGGDAGRLAANISNLNHGTLRGASADQSVFIFQIGRYIFSEWSHSGKLRVHKADLTMNLFEENLFETDVVSREILVDNAVVEWIHSSPQTYFWQREVEAWIGRHCKGV